MTGDTYDLYFYFDPVCPFAWLTSRWVEMVAEEREYRVDWRFISLRVLNKEKDYDREFPPEYEAGHNAGLRLLRVCAAVRSGEGRATMGPLYAAISSSIFDVDQRSNDPASRVSWGTPDHIEPILQSQDLATRYAEALHDDRWDAEIEAETEEALDKAGRDVGTPILAFDPPDGPGFFGPVISRIPPRSDAVALWDSVIHLASYPGFAELKRSLRERPQLRSFGVTTDEAGQVEDWHGGSRRLNSEKG